MLILVMGLSRSKRCRQGGHRQGLLDLDGVVGAAGLFLDSLWVDLFSSVVVTTMRHRSGCIEDCVTAADDIVLGVQ